jgi:hypothetical protein
LEQVGEKGWNVFAVKVAFVDFQYENLRAQYVFLPVDGRPVYNIDTEGKWNRRRRGIR